MKKKKKKRNITWCRFPRTRLVEIGIIPKLNLLLNLKLSDHDGSIIKDPEDFRTISGKAESDAGLNIRENSVL